MLKKILKLFSNNDNIVIGSNVIINNNVVGDGVFINGKKVESFQQGISYEITIEGSVNKLDTTGPVTVNGNVLGDVDTTGRVTVNGDVGGDIDTTGAVSAHHVSGNIDTIGSITIGGRK
jgi:hypothetical protein